MTKLLHRSPRYWLHWVLAHPFYLTWIVGSIGSWIPLSLQFQEAGVFDSLTADWSTIPLVLVCYAATSGLGFYAALFTVSWLILAISRRVSGAPHEIGETVMILAGPFTGRQSTIYEIPRGQGGHPVARVDLGDEARQKNQDTFDEYCLLRMSRRPAA